MGNHAASVPNADRSQPDAPPTAGHAVRRLPNPATPQPAPKCRGGGSVWPLLGGSLLRRPSHLLPSEPMRTDEHTAQVARARCPQDAAMRRLVGFADADQPAVKRFLRTRFGSRVTEVVNILRLWEAADSFSTRGATSGPPMTMPTVPAAHFATCARRFSLQRLSTSFPITSTRVGTCTWLFSLCPSSWQMRGTLSASAQRLLNLGAHA